MAKVMLTCVGGPECGEEYLVEQNDFLHELPFGGMARYIVVFITKGRGWRSRRKQVLLYEPLEKGMKASRW